MREGAANFSLRLKLVFTFCSQLSSSRREKILLQSICKSVGSTIQRLGEKIATSSQE